MSRDIQGNRSSNKAGQLRCPLLFNHPSQQRPLIRMGSAKCDAARKGSDCPWDPLPREQEKPEESGIQQDPFLHLEEACALQILLSRTNQINWQARQQFGAMPDSRASLC